MPHLWQLIKLRLTPGRLMAVGRDDKVARLPHCDLTLLNP
jgi:hypothetical protein